MLFSIFKRLCLQDVQNVIFQGQLDGRLVYMVQLLGFHDPNKPIYVCDLKKKSLNGLKKSSWFQYHHLNYFLLIYGFVALRKILHSLFIYQYYSIQDRHFLFISYRHLFCDICITYPLPLQLQTWLILSTLQPPIFHLDFSESLIFPQRARSCLMLRL